MFRLKACAVIVGAMFSTAAFSSITVDGTLDSDYGAPTAHVGYDAAAADSNFGAPSAVSKYSAYDIYLKGQDGFVFGMVKSADNDGLPFANLYFDVDYGTRAGSDIGFEIDASRTNMFVPENGTMVRGITGVATALSSDGKQLEFAIPTSYFTTPLAGLTYNSHLTLPAVGDHVRLNLSQSFGYSVAGGQGNFGDSRLGTAALTSAPATGAGAVPEPSSWAMMVGGFGLLGGTLRRGRRIAAGAVRA